MGLDATVYCDCFEKGHLKEFPLCSNASVSADGSLECASEDLDVLLAFDQWLRDDACSHPEGILLHHRIGNLTDVGWLREELAREGDRFPVLLRKVLYSGTHTGDHLSSEDIVAMQGELEQFTNFVCLSSKRQPLVDNFRVQMIALSVFR
jgi:hypothetical protein